MLDATIQDGDVLKKIIDSIKDLVTEANWDCSEDALRLQAMDSSHVSLVGVLLRREGFSSFRCDNSMSLGINLASLSKVLKCAGAKDAITLRSEEGGDQLNMLFESPNKERVSDFMVKLVDLDAEVLGIPDTEYECVVKFGANDFKKLCSDMQTIGDTMQVDVNKERVQFSVQGDLGSGKISLQPRSAMDVGSDEEPSQSSSEEEDEDDEDIVVKSEEGQAKKSKRGKKRKRSSVPKTAKVEIQCRDPCCQTFALRYLNFFAKASCLASHVTLSLKDQTPLMVEFQMESLGYVRFYLAPKIEDDDE